MSITPAMIRKTLGAPELSGDDALRVLEIAALAVAADDRLAPEELAIIYALSAELGVPTAKLDPVLALGNRDDRLAHLRAAAAALKSSAAPAAYRSAQGPHSARELAYKLTVLTSIADLAAADEEFEFDLDVQDALELDTETAARLANEVHEALTPDES